MELKDWTYEDMPDYDGEIPEGAHVLETTGNESGPRYLKDIVYAQTPEGDMKLQIIIPVSRNTSPNFGNPDDKNEEGEYPEGYFDKNPKYPCILYVQGSAWYPQYLYGDVAAAGRLADKGYVVAIVEYRDSTRAFYPIPILDTLNAIRFMRKNAAQFCVDPEKILISGNSSGGHTAMMAGIWCKEDRGENYYPGVSAEVRGIINLYGATDFTFEDSNPITPEHCLAESPEGKECGGLDMTPEVIKEFSVKTHVTPEKEIPPVLIFHGTKDRLVNCKCSVYLYEKLKECGKDAELYLLKAADHGNSEFWSPEVLDIMDRFIKRVID